MSKLLIFSIFFFDLNGIRQSIYRSMRHSAKVRRSDTGRVSSELSPLTLAPVRGRKAGVLRSRPSVEIHSPLQTENYQL